MKKPIRKHCRGCGKMFLPTADKKWYCSPQEPRVKGKQGTVVVTCKFCGKKCVRFVSVYNRKVAHKRMFCCSHKCSSLLLWKMGLGVIPCKFKKKYNGRWMRSSWEVAFARWCRVHKIKYRYEPRRFALIGKSYLPDFYLVDSGLYIEIKGFLWTGRGAGFAKAEEFSRLYNVEVCILVRHHLQYLGVLP